MANISYAKSTLGGRLVRDPEIKTTPSGTAVCTFPIAVKSRRKSASGDPETDFFDLTAFGKTAEMINRYFHKGSCILVDCTPSQRKWTDKDGKNHSAVGFAVDNVYFVDSKNESEGTAYVPDNYKTESPTFEEVADDSDLPF